MALLARAFPWRCALTAVLGLLVGVLPAVFAFLVAGLVDALPEAVDGGFDSAGGRSVVGLLAGIGVVLVAQELVRASYQVVRWDLYRRYEEYLLGRVLQVTVTTPRLEFFEDPELAAKADRAVRIAQYEPGDLVDGLSTKWGRQAQGLAATVLVATVWPLAAVLVAVVWLVVGRWMQANLLRSDLFRWENAMRRAHYFTRLGGRPEWAKEVRVFGLVDWLADRFGRQWALVMEEMAKARRVNQGTLTVLLAAVILTNAIVLALTARAALNGALGLGEVMVLAQGLLGMAFLANQAGDHLIEYGTSRVPTVLGLEQTAANQIPLPSGTTPAADRPVREIRFEDVWFTYPGTDRPVFAGLDLRIEAEHSVGIVGVNGAGKTTLIKLLAGLEAPQRGRIIVDDVDLVDLDMESWRRSLAAIFQDFVRYELSARANIGFGAVEQLHRTDVDAQVRTAAHHAGADSILADLPHGLDTPLSRRFAGGIDVSGGQWQRIALARAIMAVRAGARVLVLDEPTAQLDVRAEADIYDRFLDLTRGLTTIVISHRFSTVRRADRIVVLDAGRISEDGSHQELVAADGAYARLFRKQAMSYTDPDTGGTDA